MPTELNLSLRLQPKQSELLELCEDSQASTIGYGGSRGGGKSGAARRVMLLRRLNNPGTTGLIFRRVYDDLKRNHIDKFFEEFPHLFRFYRSTDHEVVLPAAPGQAPSRIVFGYAETETEVKRKFHGPEYMDMFIDQGEQLSELELKLMKTACRWPGTSRYKCKFVVFFNPGGIGLTYFKRVFKDKDYRDKEKENDFAFIQAYGWDNVEWVRSALIEDGLTEDDFYAWSSDTRFDYFINRSEYGQQLDGLPPAMRIGHLMGSLDTFAGQYFDVWEPARHVRFAVVEPWHPKWISIDWGFAHDSAVLWWAQDALKTRTYRELVKSSMGPRELALKIIEMSQLGEEREQIDAIYLSPDAFAKRTTEDTIANQMGVVFREHGLPMPRRADNDRVSGWMLMHEMLQYGRWEIDPSCKSLIKNLPLFARDDDKPEDCLKFVGDDPGDSARYGLKSRFAARQLPEIIRRAECLRQVRQNLEQKSADPGAINTAIHLADLRFLAEQKRKNQPVRIIRNRRGRI